MGAGRYGWGDAGYLLRRRFARIVLVGGLVFAACAAAIVARAPSYTASVRLVVVPAAGADDGRAARNQAELLRDPGLVRALGPQLLALAREAPPGWRVRAGLERRTDDAGVLAGQVSAALQVAAMGDTDVVAAGLHWPDRAFAAGALDLIVGQYQRVAGAALATRERLRSAQADMAAAQARLAEVQTGAGALGEDAAVLDAALQRIEARIGVARGQADALRLDRALAQRRLAAMEASYRSGGWVEGGDAASGDDGTAPLPGGFAVLMEKRQALLGATKVDSAAVRALDREIARVRQQSYTAARQAVVDRIAGLDDRLGVLTAAVADDEAARHALDHRATGAALAEAELRTATRRVGDARLALAHARDAADAGWQAAGVARVVSSAAASAEADGPPPGWLWALACCGTLAAGLGSAAWAQARRLTIDRPADITRQLGIEVLARLEDLRPVGAP